MALGICLWCVSLLSPRLAHARQVQNGPLVAAEFRLGSVQWVDDFAAVVESPNRIAVLDFERSSRSRTLGGSVRLGWTLLFSDFLAWAPRLSIGYSKSGSVSVVYDTGLDSYDFRAKTTWTTTTVGSEFMLAGLFGIDFGIGPGALHSSRFEGGTWYSHVQRSYVTSLGIRFRLPPGAPFAGYLGLGQELLGLNPFRKLWEGRWSFGSLVFLRVGIDFDVARWKKKP